MKNRVIFLGIVLALFGCESHAPDGGGVVASIYPLGMIAKEVAGDQLPVKTLVPPGANPHSYEPTPKQIASLARAELVLYGGNALEPWVARSVGKNQILVDASKLTNTVENDPHVWLDPIRAKDIAKGLAQAMVKLWPDKKDRINANLADFCGRVDSFDRWFRAQIDSLPDKRFVSVHPAWRYFAERYGLVEVGSLNISHGNEVSSGTLTKVIDIIRQQHVKAVFGSVRGNPDEVSVLVKETGVKVALLDPIGDPQDPKRSDYVSLMFYNANEILRVMR